MYRAIMIFTAVSLSLAFILVLMTVVSPFHLSYGFKAGYLLQPFIHQDITQEALPFLRPNVLSLIKDGNMNADDPLGSFLGQPYYHFDNCQFEEATMSINDRYDEIMGTPTEFPPGSLWFSKAVAFGRILHTVQDFYSHSNWIEHGKTNPQTDLIDDGLGLWTLLHPYTSHKGVRVIEGSIESYGIQPGTSDRPFAFNSNIPNFSPALISGIYGDNNHCPNNVRIYHNDEGPIGRGLNKDMPGRLGFDQAKTMAISQTRHEWCRLVNLERMTNGQHAVDLLFQWYVNDRQQAENACRAAAPPTTPTPPTMPPLRPTLRITWSDPHIHASPDPATASTYVRFRFEALSNSANIGITSFTCILDGNVYPLCGSASGNPHEQGSFEYPVDTSNDPPLSGGPHHFIVRAFDTLGNSGSASVRWEICPGDNEDEIRLCLFLHQSEIIQLQDNRTITDCIECEVPFTENWTGRYEDSFPFITDEGPLESNVTGSGEFSFRILENNIITGRGYGKIGGFVDYMDSQGCGEYFNGDLGFSIGGKFDPRTSKARLIFFNVSDIENTFRCKEGIEVRSNHTGFVGYWLGHRYCGIDECSTSYDNNNNHSSGSDSHITRFEISLKNGAIAQASSPKYEGVYSTISFFSSPFVH